MDPKPPRSIKDIIMPMASGGVLYGSDQLTGHHRRLSPDIIKTIPYLCHDLHAHTVVPVALGVDVDWKELLESRKLPYPSLVISPANGVMKERWLLWDLSIPVLKSNASATIYWRDTMFKLTRSLTLADPISLSFCGNPQNTTLWSCEVNGARYTLKELKEGASESLRSGEWSEDDYKLILADLHRHVTKNLMRNRRNGDNRPDLEAYAKERMDWVLQEFDYSSTLFGGDLYTGVIEYIDYLLSYPPEHWISRFSSIQSERGSRKGADQREQLRPEAIRLYVEKNMSKRDIAARLEVAHTTINRWLKDVPNRNPDKE